MHSSAPREGTRAPDFSLEAQDGRKIALSDYLGVKSVVLFFYPKDFTPGCTAETKSFGENYAALQSLGAEVLGISTGSVASHSDFAKECGANFPLLADHGGKVRELYGVKKSLGVIPGRATFVIDKQSIIRRIFSSQLNARAHIDEALRALRQN
jgi:thioredoxin-dependent peroxiredoxin